VAGEVGVAEVGVGRWLRVGSVVDGFAEQLI
jgi:hypothetical protein